MNPNISITPPSKIDNERESCFELLRILSQIMIVLYHICYIWQSGHFKGNSFFQTVSIPLHIGVILFILISGYFMIRPTSKGVVKLIGTFLVYDMVEIVYNIHNSDGFLTAAKQLFFLSSSHFWFIKTYLFLYLVSPILNMWLNNASPKQRWYMVLVFFFVSSWMGTTKGDPTMANGKNLVNFISLYLIGNQIYYYRNKWIFLKTSHLVIVYLLLMFVIIVPHYYLYGTIISKVIFRLSFPYCSPLILISSILFFIIIGKQKFQNKTVNYLAKSSLAIYLIHALRPFMPALHNKITAYIQLFIMDNLMLFVSYFLYSIIVVILCVIIDKLLQPIWASLNRISINLYKKIGY